MAVKICTVSGACISCGGDLADTIRLIGVREKAGDRFYCCGGSCVAIDKITTVVAERQTDDGDDDRGDDDRWGSLDLGHPDIVILTGGHPSRRRPRATPVEPGDPWTPEGETSDPGSG